jgi:hypothetical protein
LDLTIPVIRPNGNSTKTKDILIDYSTNWQHVHWQAIRSAYGNSPFFEILEPELAHLYNEKEKKLIDFNEKTLIQAFLSLGFPLHFKHTLTYQQNIDSFLDYRDSIHPKKRMQKPDHYFKPAKYYQVFTSKFGFKPNLSFIDLIFNEGPEAISKCKSYYSEL